MTQPIIEAYAEIRARAHEVSVRPQARCPVNACRTLYGCLRDRTRCPSECPYVNDWIGPNAE